MKKRLLFLSALLLAAGCQNQPEPGKELAGPIRVHFHQPEAMQIIEALQFDLAGEIEADASDNRTFFYQIDDGHGDLAAGELHLENNGRFNQTVTIANPTNPAGAISVYADRNGDGVLDAETDQLISAHHMIRFAEGIQVPLTPLSEPERSAVDREDRLEPSLLDAIRKEVYAQALALRDNWRTEWAQFEQQQLSAYMVEEDYLITWASDGAGPSVLLIFKQEQQQWRAVYTELIGRDVTAVRVMEGLDRGSFIAAESYYPEGTGVQSTHVDLYFIDDERIKKVWEMQNASVTSATLEDGAEEQTRVTLTYSILPTHMQPEPGIVLTVYGEQTVVRRQGGELLAKEVTPLNTAYVWDEKELRFIELSDSSP